MLGVEVFDPEMVGEPGYDYRLTKHLADRDIDYIAKTTNANTIAHFVPEKSKRLNNCIESIHRDFPNAEIHVTKVAIVSVIGSIPRTRGKRAVRRRSQRARHRPDHPPGEHPVHHRARAVRMRPEGAPPRIRRTPGMTVFFSA